jgi:hypothetical protein
VPNFLVIVGQGLPHEFEDQRLAEIELVLVGYFYVPFVVDIFRKLVFLHVVADFGMVVQTA